jgi:hypothetical protein
MMKKNGLKSVGREVRAARQRWGTLLGTASLQALRCLVRDSGVSVAAGDLLLLENSWYVTHAGLLRLASRRHCAGICVNKIDTFCDPNSNRWAFRATVYKSRTCKGFVGFGDADPSNVSAVVCGAEMRVAETRAVNRALRKAYGIGICSIEELGARSVLAERANGLNSARSGSGNGNENGGPKLRDQLCLLIRQHHLDASLVKRYAIEFCGACDLRQASREQVEAFVKHVSEFAAKDPGGLAVKLNSYAEKQEGAGAA